ncbi:hypothetical protein MUB24_11020 [Lederbergia sp. NSJ-179]|uniref:alpha/beta hydrolase n=1 Tax=Lederbergia sp. NSJ-179 TaxID=2931402 RepID=UPI001FD5F69C|nr:hypothetical protein [Lederbergia sp. NSJ-179]MCJ7841418.1 hypothetical protein [Lederbergia sp. NSJ-179]
MRVLQFDFPVIEKTYKNIGTRDLKLYIFEPEGSMKKRSAILFFIGGSFKKNPQSPAVFQHQANYYFSQLGMVAICVDYRAGHDEGFTPKQAIADAKSSVRWVLEEGDYEEKSFVDFLESNYAHYRDNSARFFLCSK